ncbi:MULTISPECIES: 30S ribosomal protein S6--L-glutamate ligase [Flavobacterium]|jgi:ribosomal protein S6--L-glutamate ligase|uniref:Probable alpha-L-glutamate ligase n=2 Tax=Flavobacterium johnsoniae TaxID=986 RepID=A0A1M5PDZ4_FLAJO|nr:MULTISPECIES: 30S ribosomal protein S6--L-glutamate ligase [Flavobacterium]ABQ05609.1 SSU ribosomal protein S6P modification protein [Flavobacterium johnsoniae UW101]OXG00118.1 alpha-L-glutamate ligase [Flavobacterium johnsoniae UW101]WDF61309.1 30S ribosomal protein S6--L-glutamate ligase [Flavobacterium sp. KACC 22758]WQG82588.1 30S ribosomal protein S6--L-glutamate ligase [Flavobacterium johnsoniae UW101]SHG99719.1 SSU ribosomal protein S6P modification protein [Flavobacterium johnsoniae
MLQNKVILGSEEWCSFPELGIPTIKARVDSGAKTSAMHAINIAPFIKNDANWVKFDINPIQNNIKTIIHCEAPLVDKRIVKSSSGYREHRYVIQTHLKIGDAKWPIEMTLTNRDSMGFRMLLGREAMSGRVLVDPEQKYLLGQPSPETLKELYQNSEKATTGLRIGLLASNPELYSNKRIMEAGEMRGHEMHFLNIKECYMKLDAKKPEIHYRGGKILNEFDAIIPRIRPSITFYGCALTRQFEALKVFVLNSATAITQSRDKLYSLQLLLNSGIDIPTTGFANSPLDTDNLIKMVGGSPLIVKLLEGTQGKGVVLAETKKAAESVINAFKSLNANILVQEFIKEANGKDIRCFVIDGKVVAAIQREAMPGEFRANIHLGGTASVIKVTAEEKKIAIKAAKAMDLKVAGVDIIRSSKGPLLLEVNSSPGLEGIEGATNKDVAGEMIKAIEKNFKL